MSKELSANTTLSHYCIARKLGAGGMGEVYVAEDTRLKRQVAIKVLTADFAQDRERVQRFEREAQATSALNHPNILTVFDIGTYEDSPFIVAELLEGEELRDRMNRGPLSWRRAIDYAQQVVSGLAAAHEKGIVHRDLKPENLFITKDGRVKILDFGLAKVEAHKPDDGSGHADPGAATQTQLTTPGLVMGTISYMLPEQARGQEIDTRSDIFSMGAVLYEMFAGRQPFVGANAIDVLGAILNKEPESLKRMGLPE